MDEPTDLAGRWAQLKLEIHQCRTCVSLFTQDQHRNSLEGAYPTAAHHPLVPGGVPVFDAKLVYRRPGQCPLPKDQLDEMSRLLGVKNWMRRPVSFCPTACGPLPWVAHTCHKKWHYRLQEFLPADHKVLILEYGDQPVADRELATEHHHPDRWPIRRTDPDWTTYEFETSDRGRGVVIRTRNIIIANAWTFSKTKNKVVPHEWYPYRNAVLTAWLQTSTPS